MQLTVSDEEEIERQANKNNELEEAWEEECDIEEFDKSRKSNTVPEDPNKTKEDAKKDLEKEIQDKVEKEMEKNKLNEMIDVKTN